MESRNLKRSGTVQFVKNGPDIPDSLLQLHEDGQVIFFCGAGISRPAGLPDFKILTKRLYEACGVEANELHKRALEECQFDRAIGLLEADYLGGRVAVRRKIANILLAAKTDKEAFTQTHRSLLTLGKARDGKTRLVSTNFDRLFEFVMQIDACNPPRFCAPHLPMTKTVWNGLVYLHGLLSESPTEEDLDRIVVSSGDFGLAYLTERWASAFVTELFRNFTICFVGYSLSDPVLRYMTDALAADKLRGEHPREMFAFSDYGDGKEEECRLKWRSKNVTPILYSIKDEENHEALHRTLHTWAAIYRDGLSGKESIIRDYASLDPGQSTSVDHFQGRVTWALSDPSGVPARLFAEMEPVPPFSWLAAVIEPNWQLWKQHPKIQVRIHQWLIRHLDNPELALFLARRPDWKTTNLVLQINEQLKKIHNWETEDKTAELNALGAHSPDGIPRPAMRTFWRLFLADRIAPSNVISFDLYTWA
ncbi:SIR2 family protein, partial [Myxococcota bacterium]|nr:SIR2 family protein [Myxococcota bacterium]